MKKQRKFYCAITLCCCLQFLHAQQVPGLNKKNPVILNGSIGASANFYSSNEHDTLYSRPSFAWNTFGNVTFRTKNLTIPASFVINQYSGSKSPAFAQYGISPTSKWAKLHLGYRYIPLSPLIFEGQSFRGAGLELNPGLFRFAAFYGRLNKAVDEDTSRRLFTVPRFARTGYGARIGIGNFSNFFDLVYFHAKDDSNSVSIKKDSLLKRAVKAQENTVLGSSFKLTLIKKIIWTGDIAVSGITHDLSYFDIDLDSAKLGQPFKYIRKILPVNASTVASYAGQSTLSFNSKFFNTSIGYRRVEPDFKSLGTPYMINDIELLSWTNNAWVANGKLNISTSLSQQHNNLNKKSNSELKTLVSNVTLNALFGQHVNISFGYSGYNLDQRNGTVVLSDSFLLKQQISQFYISPTWHFAGTTKVHTISGHVDLSVLDDKNPATSAFTNSTNLSSSLNYTLGLTRTPINFTLNALHNKYKLEANTYTSTGGTVGASLYLLKEQSLSLQGNIGYLINDYTAGEVQNNITYSANAGYQGKHHAVNLYANYVYTPENRNSIKIIHERVRYAVATQNLAGGLSYTYSF
ncbi:MAG: hypothetical protein WKF97_08675 [Chitinophagaceae bacterium]